MTCWLSLKVLLSHGFDVIHAANPPDVFFILGIFYRLFGKMYVFDQHDPVPEMFRAKFKGSSAGIHKLLLFLEYCNYRTSDLVITSNLSQKRLAIERGHCSPHKVIVVRNGPDLHHMYPVPPDPKLKLGRRYLLAYVGVMGTQDGIESTIYALHHLVYERGRQDVSLVLVGDGDCLPSLSALVHTLHLESFVHFAGWVDPGDIPRYLSTADVGLVPDLQNGMNEFCTMIKTMEYMAIGKPIVAFDLAETRFSAQEAALYAIPNQVEDFAQKIEILLDDEDGRRRMGAIGSRRVMEELSWEHSKAYLLAAYQMLFRSAPIASEVPVARPGTLVVNSSEVSDSALPEQEDFIRIS
jgi:glycosyltransferase involved in cell wall biosynthesis